jgi:hypothetical protein
MPFIMCFQDPPGVEPLNHTPLPHVNSLSSKLIDGKGTRGRFFENLRSITTFVIFPTWEDLLGTLAFARPPPTAL